jgi:hypothetical protein
VTERRVPLPERWLRGFAEVQVAASDMRPAFEISAVEARRFLRSLGGSPAGRRSGLWAVPAGKGLRLSGQPSAGAVCVAGPERLRVVEPLLRFARVLRAYTNVGADGLQACAWEVELDDARLVLTLSPEVSRGFSGEGGVLSDLADDVATEDADLVSALLAYEPIVDVALLASRGGISADRVVRALARLGAAGRVGYDVSAGAYFHRELPYDAVALETMHPRLRDARALVATGAVHLDGAVARVKSGANEYLVRATGDGQRCTCPWFAKHGNGRGPCKHILAVEITLAT